MKRLQFCLEGAVSFRRDFEHDQRFVGVFQLPLPPVDRLGGRHDVGARNDLFRHELLANSTGGFRIWKRAKRDSNWVCHDYATAIAAFRQIQPPPSTISPS